MRKQEMHNTRGRSKKRAEEKEKEEGGQEREIEIVTDSEMEQPVGDKEETEAIMSTEKEIVEEDAQAFRPDKAEARGKPTCQEVMKFIAEQFRKHNERLNKINENFRKQEETSKKQNETLKEQNKQTNEKIDSIQAVSYTHLDVYKRQINVNVIR